MRLFGEMAPPPEYAASGGWALRGASPQRALLAPCHLCPTQGVCACLSGNSCGSVICKITCTNPTEKTWGYVRYIIEIFKSQLLSRRLARTPVVGGMPERVGHDGWGCPNRPGMTDKRAGQDG